jgi:hypothetical protein
MQVQQINLPAQYTPGVYVPALDLVGTSPANLVDGEEQVFDANTESAHTFIMPTFGPFYANSLQVRVKNSDDVFVTMTLGVDYSLVFPFLSASRALGVPMYGGIRFTGIGTLTTVRLKYQSVGGRWVMSPTVIAGLMLGELRHPGAVALEQVAPFNTIFPVVNQPWDRQDPATMLDVSAKIDEMVLRMKQRHGGRSYITQTTHLSRQDNPHNLSKSLVGLGSVVNLPPAGAQSSQNPANTSEYISTAQVNAMMLSWVIPASASQQGVAKLNLGINPGDDSDSANALTAAGFTNITSNTDSAINRAYNKGQLPKTVTPFPFDYPILWRGVQYNNKQAFVAAVQAFVGVYPLEFNDQNGTFWFPANTPLPTLAISEV